MTDSETTTPGDENQGQDRLEGRAKVRRLMWDRLDEAGVGRPKGWTLDQYAGWRTRMADRLAYMSAENLETLAETIIDNAPAARCPSETVIRQWAKGLEPPPVEEARLVTSWLASVEGPAALAGGFEVELFRHLRGTGKPPSPYDMTRIRREASDNHRQVQILTERSERSTIQPHDRDWLEAFQRDRDRVRRIIAEGQARREVAQ